MEQLSFDSGVRTYRLGEMGVLRFNPADPNLFGRFLDAVEKITALEQALVEKAETLARSAAGDGTQVLALLKEADGQVKALLGQVFGCENDMDSAVGGVNLLAVASNGERVITNLIAALEPVLLEGAKRCAWEEAGK